MTDPSPATRPMPAAVASIAGPVVVAAAALVVAVSVLFLAFPGIDLWASGAFFAPGRGFFLRFSGVLVGFRNSADVLVAAAAVLLLASVAVKLARPERPSPIAPNLVLFLLSSLVLGPGLLVNLILKDHWGRPRPIMIAPLGGGSPYVPVWEISDFCSRNCSFVAGEASAAVWLVGVALILPRRWRLPGAIVASVYAVLIGLNRIAFGGHFLSDVLLSFGLTLLVMAILYRVLVERPPAVFAGPVMEARLTRLGRRLRAKRAERTPAAKR